MTPDQLEEESVGMLAVMMGVDNDQARRVLRKHNGNVEKAADAMLTGDNGDDEPPPLWPTTPENSQNHYVDPTQLSTQHPPPSQVIDLSADDDESMRTMNLIQAQSDIKFGPTERAPHPEWQMVTTNTPVNVNVNQEDQAMNEAIQASLAEFGHSSDELEMFAMEDNVREGCRPVALRTEASEIQYAALMLQALSQIPQARHHIATLLDSADEGSHRPTWCMHLVELFVNLDLAILSSMVDKDLLPCFRPMPWDGSFFSLGNACEEFIKIFAADVDAQINIHRSQEDPTVRLFQFVHAKAELRGHSIKLRHPEQPGSVVDISAVDAPVPNDLISRLSHNLSKYDEVTRTSEHDVIVKPSELVIINIRRGDSTGHSKSAEPFSFPKQFYLDRFLYENLHLAQEKKAEEREIRDEIAELLKKKEFLTRNEQGRDVLTDLRTTLHYFEEVARKDQAEREESINRTAKKLRGLLDSVISSVQEIDAGVEKLQVRLKSLYDIPDLQKHLYVLRTVFMHTGLPGRKQIYSYIQDSHGVWWKTMDHTVTEVPEETALTDPTGLHLGAGPYLLIYSRALSDDDMKAPVVWPQDLVNSLMESNATFLRMLPPHAAAKAQENFARVAAVSAASVPTMPSVDRGKALLSEDVSMSC